VVSGNAEAYRRSRRTELTDAEKRLSSAHYSWHAEKARLRAHALFEIELDSKKALSACCDAAAVGL
jgi:hypothetical protein